MGEQSRFQELLQELGREHEDCLARLRGELVALRQGPSTPRPREPTEHEKEVLSVIQKSRDSQLRESIKAPVQSTEECISTEMHNEGKKSSLDGVLPNTIGHVLEHKSNRVCMEQMHVHVANAASEPSSSETKRGPSNRQQTVSGQDRQALSCNRAKPTLSYNPANFMFDGKDHSNKNVVKALRGSIYAHKQLKNTATFKNSRLYELWNYCQARFESMQNMLEKLERPDLSQSCVGRLVMGETFNSFSFFVIIVDSVFTAHTLNHSMASGRDGLTEFTQTLSMCVLGFYVLEIALKLKAYGRFFFLGKDAKWNLFDAALVAQAIVTILLDVVLSVEGADVTFIRLLRLMKLAKIFRFFRVVKYLRELKIMVITIANSFLILFWAFVTLGMVLYVFSLIFVQALSGYIIDNHGELDDDTLALIRFHFGSVQASALTLYQCSSNGLDWTEVYDLVQLSGWFYALAFIFFIGFCNFAVLNILTGIFLDKALAAATPDRDSMALEQRRHEEHYANELLELLVEMDEDNSGTLSAEEFTGKLEDDYIQAYLATLGLNIQDAHMFFCLLCRFSGKSELPIEEFVWRCVRMKGNASSLDLQAVAYEVSIIHFKIREMGRALGLSRD